MVEELYEDQVFEELGTDVTRYYKDEGCAQAIARNDYFQTFVLFVIAFNVVWLSIDADFNYAQTIFQASSEIVLRSNN